ncbi:pyridoxal phosphate-dependent transferase [Gautieria morchelliformis]|nr:pyridoxal phosphate-dependent transferase [Gautieria morchelliformis]
MSMQEKSSSTTSKAIDLSHHLSELSKARKPSPLKSLQKYVGRPGLISLAGGTPDPAYFPFASLSADALLPDAFPRTKPSESSLLGWFWSIFGKPSEKTARFTVPKYRAQPGDVDLATALQYSPVTGMQPLQEFIHNFTSKVFKPAYSDWTTLVHTGNTDGFHRSMVTFCNPGEHVLVEEWTYPSTMNDIQSLGMFATPVKVDGEGMSAVDLEHVLSTWDESVRKAKRPHVIYTIPVGQNPTGATMGVERKKAIYQVCVKYDVIIVEDDPYYFLQEGPYNVKEQRSTAKTTPQLQKGEDEETRYLNSLEPSFVRFDYQGRVIRLETFSKTIAPGSRLGWFTCNPVFAERLERQGETTTMAPCGFSQSLITQLLSKHWSFSDFIRWLQGLQTQYIIRRDFFVDCIFEEFEVRPTSDSQLLEVFGSKLPVFTAYVKTGEHQRKRGMAEKTHMHSEKTPLFSFVPPSAGMFVWLKFHLQDHVVVDPDAPIEERIDTKVWTDLAEHGLLVAPGMMFGAQLYDDQSTHSPKRTVPYEIGYRVSFSMGTQENMRAGVKILAEVLKKYVKF